MLAKDVDYVLTRMSKKRKFYAKGMAKLSGCGITTVLAADTDVQVSIVSAAVLTDLFIKTENECRSTRFLSG